MSAGSEPPALELGAAAQSLATQKPPPAAAVVDTSDTESVSSSRSEREAKAAVRPAQKIALLWIYWACKLCVATGGAGGVLLCESKCACACARSPSVLPAVDACADVCCYLCRKNYPLLLPTLAKAGMLTTAEAGIVASVFEAVVGAVKFFCGVFVDRHANPAKLLSQCLFVTGGSCLAMQATFWTARSASLRVILVALFWSLNGAGQAVRSHYILPCLVVSMDGDAQMSESSC